MFMDSIDQTTLANALYRHELSDICCEYGEDYAVCCFTCFEEVETKKIAVVSGRLVCTECVGCVGMQCVSRF